MSITIGRNDPCHCGSGKKFKKCHLEKDEAKDRKEREKAALNAAKVAADEAEKNEKAGVKPAVPSHKPQDQQGWMGKMAGKLGFSRGSQTQRRTPSANKAG